MRWHILRVLLLKEILRHAANRGAIAMVLLLVAAAFLLSLFGNKSAAGSTLLGGAKHCYIDYWQEGPHIEHLRTHIPPEFEGRITVRAAANAPIYGGRIFYPPGNVAIQLRPAQDEKSGSSLHVHVWNADTDGSAVAPFEAWFWKELRRHLRDRVAANYTPRQGVDRSSLDLADVKEERSQLDGAVDTRSAIATSLVLFGVFFVCVYLLPSLTCEERERGVLLAQALSPASPLEILAARFLFYPVVGMVVAGVLAGIYSPAALTRPFFWLALAIAAFGSMGVGLTISTLARTQRTASMGALCYMLAVALILLICQQNNISGIPWLALEYHLPRVFQAVLSDSIRWYHGWNLAGAAALAVVWASLAAFLFRRYGWQ